jgi:GTP-binding protein
MTFVDEAIVYVKAGRGGNGSASMHSEPYKPHGGPDGGNGGSGGSVVFEVSRGVHDLSWVADHPHQRATNGVAGRSAKRDGASGKDLLVPVPDGTVVYDEAGLIADLVGEGSRAMIAQGGRGGRGNASLASARNRVPRTAEPGEDEQERRLRVELRTVADVGLVGLPNAGKSTLLSRLSAAKPKIADYPFTTLTPNLGVADAGEQRFVVADIPGLVEGAHEGRGLGHRFLRHILRCRALVLMVDLASDDPSADLATLRAELAAYDPELGVRRAIVVGAKADLVDDAGHASRALAPDALAVSAVTGEGLQELTARLGLLAEETKAAEPERTPYVVLRPGRPRFTVTRERGGWRVKGQNVERWVLETDLEDEVQVAKLQRRLIREGVERQLTEMGARPGDDVAIGASVFGFEPEGSIGASSEAPSTQEALDGR